MGYSYVEIIKPVLAAEVATPYKNRVVVIFGRLEKSYQAAHILALGGAFVVCLTPESAKDMEKNSLSTTMQTDEITNINNSILVIPSATPDKGWTVSSIRTTHPTAIAVFTDDIVDVWSQLGLPGVSTGDQEYLEVTSDHDLRNLPGVFLYSNSPGSCSSVNLDDLLNYVQKSPDHYSVNCPSVMLNFFATQQQTAIHGPPYRI